MISIPFTTSRVGAMYIADQLRQTLAGFVGQPNTTEMQRHLMAEIRAALQQLDHGADKITINLTPPVALDHINLQLTI